MASLVQLEYALALQKEGSFRQAAKKSFVTQPTLSMQIQKLEEELGVSLFDRTRRPIVATDIGSTLLDQFQMVCMEYSKIASIRDNQVLEVSGVYKLGIIPTLAPGILPEILEFFKKEHPKVKFIFSELTTKVIVRKIKERELDAGLLSSPLGDPLLFEEFIFEEPLVLIHSSHFVLPKKIQVKDIPFEKLLILKEGHCLRNQVLDLCKLEEKTLMTGQTVEVSSLSLMRNLVLKGDYCSIVPLLSTKDLGEVFQEKNISFFGPKTPVRQISLVTYQHQIKKPINNILVEFTRRLLPSPLEPPSPKIILSPR